MSILAREIEWPDGLLGNSISLISSELWRSARYSALHPKDVLSRNHYQNMLAAYQDIMGQKVCS